MERIRQLAVGVAPKHAMHEVFNWNAAPLESVPNRIYGCYQIFSEKTEATIA